eukprot:16302568-Heterocapsa_arctica.AAC.1
MIQANNRARLPPNKPIQQLSEQLIRKHITLFGQLLRAPEHDLMKQCSVPSTGERVKADFKRVGRPRMKWYDGVRRS